MASRKWELLWVTRFRDSAVGDAHGRAPHVVVPHSIGSGCAGNVVASGPLCGRSCKLRGQSGGTWVCCRRHDAGLWQCLCTIPQISPNQGEDVVGAASMPLVLGGLALRPACRVSQPAYWASWEDALHIIHNRHPEVTALDDEPESRRDVEGVMGFDPLGRRGSTTRSWRTRIV